MYFHFSLSAEKKYRLVLSLDGGGIRGYDRLIYFILIRYSCIPFFFACAFSFLSFVSVSLIISTATINFLECLEEALGMPDTD
jgi:hypothetical protein